MSKNNGSGHAFVTRLFERTVLQHPFETALGLIVLLLISTRGYTVWKHWREQAQEAAERQDVINAKERLAQLREWPMEKVEAHPPPGQRPVTPYLRALDAEVASEQELLLKLNETIASHPHPEISRDLAGFIAAGEVGVHFKVTPGSGATMSFMTSMDTRIYNSLENAGLKTLHVRPEFTGLLSIDPVELAPITDQSEIIRFWSLISHEYVHFKQFMAEQNGSMAQSLFLVTPAASEREAYENFMSRMNSYDEEKCILLWKLEHEAYRHMIRVSWQLGLDKPLYIDEPAFSNEVDDDAHFNRSLFLHMSTNSLQFSPCAYAWAQVAGHPHPEAFKE